MQQQKVRRLVFVAILTALGVVLAYFVRFPIFPAVPFLEYDMADVAVMFCSFMFGPWWAVLATVIVSLIQGLTVSSSSMWYGILMHVIATSVFAVTAGLLYRRKHSKKGALIALLCGTLAMTAVMIPANLLITPLFMGVSVELVWQLMPFIALFNFIKAGANAMITFILYKPLKKVCKL